MTFSNEIVLRNASSLQLYAQQAKPTKTKAAGGILLDFLQKSSKAHFLGARIHAFLGRSKTILITTMLLNSLSLFIIVKKIQIGIRTYRQRKITFKNMIKMHWDSLYWKVYAEMHGLQQKG